MKLQPNHTLSFAAMTSLFFFLYYVLPQVFDIVKKLVSPRIICLKYWSFWLLMSNNYSLSCLTVLINILFIFTKAFVALWLLLSSHSLRWQRFPGTELYWKTIPIYSLVTCRLTLQMFFLSYNHKFTFLNLEC